MGSHVRVLSLKSEAEMAGIDRELAELRQSGAASSKRHQSSMTASPNTLKDDLLQWRLLDPERVWEDCEHRTSTRKSATATIFEQKRTASYEWS